MPADIFGHINPPSGTIVYFNDSVSNIPAGWVFCDGNNGTPDLRDAFQKGTPDTSTAPGSVVGQHSVSLSVDQLPSHDHYIPGTGTTGDHSHTVYLQESANDTDGTTAYRVSHNDDYNDNQRYVQDSGEHTHSLSISSTGGDSAIDNRPSFVKYVPIMKT